MCVQYDALKTLFREAKGFDFIEEGPKKKKGFVGLHPGRREGKQAGQPAPFAPTGQGSPSLWHLL